MNSNELYKELELSQKRESILINRIKLLERLLSLGIKPKTFNNCNLIWIKISENQNLTHNIAEIQKSLNQCNFESNVLITDNRIKSITEVDDKYLNQLGLVRKVN